MQKSISDVDLMDLSRLRVKAEFPALSGVPINDLYVSITSVDTLQGKERGWFNLIYGVL